ncbi:MAG TPA: glycosyltransferase family 4 protein [Noviherbaspirillum sp.]|jgi:glycosyltransferase involved in cell wall biosynthesis|uniref:glycosyltransferase family 4 protein n=1 Tax=Noviherbaspirillum sp. TaxID=1926288 RepID=UPI002DDD5637|nr:glycosyltransferase family 4 protein [Noviherbaspirillum sp.]HEV2608903.1 glycosyltransferase family 4 protein [Noviherbaspirillum sp.]
MKLLTFTTLFPNTASPNQAIFVETRLRHLVASGEVESRVVAPVPWFPFDHASFGRYAKFARPPREEVRFGIHVRHPRYPLIPKVGMTSAPFFMAAAAKQTIARIIDEGYDFDAIDAHYFYPDGVAAVMLGKYFNKPVVITARGSDISLIPRHHLPRRMIVWAAQNADGIITVCNALKEEMVALGVEADRITPLRNGVDLTMFRPLDKEAQRKELGLEGFTLISVGHLVPVKGHELIVGALPLLPDVRLLLAGSGPEQGRLEALARHLGVSDRITFLGAIPHAELKKYYTAADASILASSREGWANVLLESMACGTPVVASKVWGTPEVVASPDAGLLMNERSPAALAQAVSDLRNAYPDRMATRRYAEKFSWDDTTKGQIALFRQVLNARTALASA